MGSEGGDFDWNNGLVWSWEMGKKKKDGKRKEFKKDKSIGEMIIGMKIMEMIEKGFKV